MNPPSSIPSGPEVDRQPLNSSSMSASNDSAENSEIGSVEVIRDLCIGAASCVALAPETFELDPEAKAVVKQPLGNTPDEIIAAAQSCPVNAIIVKNKNGQQLWPPV